MGDYLYVVGGLSYSTGGIVASVERARIGSDGILDSWEDVTPLQVPRYELGAAAIGPFLFAVGGYNDTQGAFVSVEVAAPTAEAFGGWSYTPSPTIRERLRATAIGRTLYAVGAGNFETSQIYPVEFASLDGSDSDGDGVADDEDNCPGAANPEQADGDRDGFGDACDTCPAQADPKQTDFDSDGIGDVCDPFPNDPDNEQAQCEADLEECRADLADCRANPQLIDTDGDGEADVTDRCPSTPAGLPVDDAGCSLAQFCARFDATTRDGARACKRADWKNDEPLMKAREADCIIDKGASGSDDRCVLAPVR